MIVIAIAGMNIISSANNKSKIAISVDYKYYDTEDSLINDADTIIVGEVLDTFTELHNFNKTETRYTEPAELVYTIANIKITRVIKGEYNIGDIIKVKQLGGEYNGKKYIEESTTQFLKKQHGVFFLQTYKTGSPASLLNPVQGHIKISNSKVEANKHNKLFNNIANENDLLDLIKNKVNDK